MNPKQNNQAIGRDLSRREMLRLLFLGLFIFTPLGLFGDIPPQAPIRVACVGDSITYGAKLQDRQNESYPVWLGHWLGAGWDVRNFGSSGATLLKKGDLPYVRQREHANALAFKPDIVVIMLGTNDSKHRDGGLPTAGRVADNWQYKADFVPDYEALIAEFSNANPSAKIYICYPTPCFPGRWGIDDNTIHYEVIPLVRRIAGESRAKIINLYAPFSGKKDLFPDTVHPNAAGAKLMAAIVYHALTGKRPPTNMP